VRQELIALIFSQLMVYVEVHSMTTIVEILYAILLKPHVAQRITATIQEAVTIVAIVMVVSTMMAAAVETVAAAAVIRLLIEQTPMRPVYIFKQRR
jgi:hypothetical protein